MKHKTDAKGRLGIVLLLNPDGPLTLENVHPAHRPRLRSYDYPGFTYELRRDKGLSKLDKNAVEVYPINLSHN